MNAVSTESLQERADRGDALASFQLGMWLSSQVRWEESRARLAQASAAGIADAHAWLGLHALYGYGGVSDLPRALALLGEAEQRGSGEAAYQLAHLAWCGRLVARDPARMLARLIAAAQADHAGALRALAMVYARAPQQQAVSDACLARAAALNDRLSLYLLARRWSVRGDAAQQTAANGFFAHAAALGLPRAAGLHPPGTLPQRLQSPAVRGLPMPLSDGAEVPAAQQHSDSPLIETIDGAYTDEECEYLIATAEPLLHASVTVTREGEHMPHSDRNSSDASLLGVSEDFVARWLQARMTDRIRVPLSHSEHLVVLRYLPGQEYRPHCDWLHPGARGNLPDPEQPGQRVHTVFCYLTDVAAGGATVFPKLSVEIQPQRGRIVHFTNLQPDGRGDPRTVHAGMPVIEGEKWLATLWTRVRPARAF